MYHLSFLELCLVWLRRYELCLGRYQLATPGHILHSGRARTLWIASSLSCVLVLQNLWQAALGSGTLSMGLASACSWILNKTDEVTNMKLAVRIAVHVAKCFGGLFVMVNLLDAASGGD